MQFCVPSGRRLPGLPLSQQNAGTDDVASARIGGGAEGAEGAEGEAEEVQELPPEGETGASVFDIIIYMEH